MFCVVCVRAFVYGVCVRSCMECVCAFVYRVCLCVRVLTFGILRFLRLKAAHPTKRLVPTPVIRAAWLSHLIRPTMCVDLADRDIPQ